MVLFPSLDWLKEYEKALDEDEELDEVGEGWGVDFNGDFIFEISDLPLDEVSPKDLPDELTEDISDNLLEQMGDMSLAEVMENLSDEMLEGLPKKMRELTKLMKEYGIVESRTIYSFIGLENGKCTGTDIVQSLDAKDHGFVLSGSYENWKKLVKGELDAIQGVMRGDLELDGEMQQVMKYTNATKRMADIANNVETEFML